MRAVFDAFVDVTVKAFFGFCFVFVNHGSPFLCLGLRR
jgi:hypothetical protein